VMSRFQTLRSGSIRMVLVCAAMAVAALTASAQVKVGVINVQKALSDTDELKKTSAAMEAKYKPQQTQIEKLQADLQSIEDQLNSGKLNQTAAADLQTQGTRKQRDLQRLTDDTQAEIDKERQAVLASMSEKMSTVITKLAEEKGLDLVVETSSLLYNKASLDITADATAAYNKANPAK
jgi:outer membrane protein